MYKEIWGYYTFYTTSQKGLLWGLEKRGKWWGTLHCNCSIKILPFSNHFHVSPSICVSTSLSSSCQFSVVVPPPLRHPPPFEGRPQERYTEHCCGQCTTLADCWLQAGQLSNHWENGTKIWTLLVSSLAKKMYVHFWEGRRGMEVSMFPPPALLWSPSLFLHVC